MYFSKYTWFSGPLAAFSGSKIPRHFPDRGVTQSRPALASRRTFPTLSSNRFGDETRIRVSARFLRGWVFLKWWEDWDCSRRGFGFLCWKKIWVCVEKRKMGIENFPFFLELWSKTWKHKMEIFIFFCTLFVLFYYLLIWNF